MVLLSSSPCLSHPPPPMFPSGDPLSIHHYFHGYLAGFTVRPGSLESREVIECLYACREGLDYSDFDSLGKGMKVCPSAQLAWVSSTLLPQPCFPKTLPAPPSSDNSPPFFLCVSLSLDSCHLPRNHESFLPPLGSCEPLSVPAHLGG